MNNDSLRNGLTTLYQSGKKSAEFTYKDNLRHGKQRIYYHSGNIKEEFEYENGYEHGIHKYIFPNGNIDSLITFVGNSKCMNITYKFNKPENITMFFKGNKIGSIDLKNKNIKGNVFVGEISKNKKQIIVIFPSVDFNDIEFTSKISNDNCLITETKKELFNLNDTISWDCQIINRVRANGLFIFSDTIR